MMFVDKELSFSKLNTKLVLRSSAEIVDDIQKIAVLRANAIGDFIFSLPALYSLKSTYPQAEIVLLGLQWHPDFLTGRPGPVDRLLLGGLAGMFSRAKVVISNDSGPLHLETSAGAATVGIYW